MRRFPFGRSPKAEPSFEGTRLIGLDYYDGPLMGILHRPFCLSDYRFDLIAQHDYDDEDIRVFALKPLPAGTFDKIAKLCPKTRPIKWPVWVPEWQFISPWMSFVMCLRLYSYLWRARNTEFVVAWDNHKDVVIAAKQLSEFPMDSGTDWFAFLGL